MQSSQGSTRCAERELLQNTQKRTSSKAHTQKLRLLHTKLVYLPVAARRKRRPCQITPPKQSSQSSHVFAGVPCTMHSRCKLTLPPGEHPGEARSPECYTPVYYQT